MGKLLLLLVVGLINFGWLGMLGITLNVAIAFIAFIIIALVQWYKLNKTNQNKKEN